MAVAEVDAGAVCGKTVSSLSMSANPPRRPTLFLVIGCGSIGKRHISNLLSLNAGTILGFDPRGDRRSEAESSLGIETVDSLEEAWELCPRAALITAPTDMHVALALQAGARGCHLFIEKPLSHRLEGVDRLVEVVRARKLVTLVGCNMRFHPGLLKIKELLDREAIGRVVAARAEVGYYLPDWHPREDYRRGYSARRSQGGGVILDAIHEIDYLRWLIGEVEEVASFAGKLTGLEIDTEDTAAILVRFANGTIGELHMDYVQRAYSRTCHIIGEKGTIRWDYTSGEVRAYSPATRDWRSFVNPNGWEPNQMYIDELRHFLRCLDGEENPALDVFEAQRVLEVALAAKASNDARQVVRVPR